MATTRLSVYEVERKLLPELCMRCGEPATVQKNRTFSWYPPWVAVTVLLSPVIFIIVAAVLTKRMKVSVPLCDAHKSHWSIRVIIILLSFVALLALVAMDIALSQSEYVNILIIATVVAGLGWLVLIAVLQSTSMRPTEITDRRISLRGVAKSFADAVLDQGDRRREEEESYYDDRPPRRRREEGYDDRVRPTRQERDRERDERYRDRDSSRGREPRRARDEDEDE